MMKNFNFENEPVDVLRFELENAMANHKMAKQNLKLVKDQTPYLVPMKQAFIDNHGGEDFDTANLDRQEAQLWIRISDGADSLVAEKYLLEAKIKHANKVIKAYSKAIKKAGEYQC